ncbi:MAG: nucleoside deaminase [Cyclobacteriaceae bacterium]
MSDEELMHEAVKEAKDGNTPFGCIISRDGQVVAKAYNTVMRDHDPTEHAEMNTLRAVCRRYNRGERREMTVYTTCEPCPMCMSALLFGGFNKIIYGTDIPTASLYTNQIDIRCDDIADRSGVEVSIKGGMLEADCRNLFEEFSKKKEGN